MPNLGERIVTETQIIAQPWSSVDLNRLVNVGPKGDVTVMEMIWIIQSDGDGTMRYLLRFFEPLEGVSILRIESPDQPAKTIFHDPDVGENRVIKKTGLRDYFYHLGWALEDLTPEAGTRFNYERQGVVMLDDLVCNKIQATPAFADAEDITRYGKRILWIAQDSGELRKTNFYDWDGALIKSVDLYDYKTGNGSAPSAGARPNRATLKNFENMSTDISVTLQQAIQVDLPPEIFTEAFIEQWSPEQDAMLRSLVRQ